MMTLENYACGLFQVALATLKLACSPYESTGNRLGFAYKNLKVLRLVFLAPFA